MEHLPEFIENLQNGKSIDVFLDIKKCQKRPQARKPIFLGLGSGNSENMVPKFEKFFKLYKRCSQQNCAEWIIHFSKRAREVPDLSKHDLGGNPKTL